MGVLVLVGGGGGGGGAVWGLLCTIGHADCFVTINFDGDLYC